MLDAVATAEVDIPLDLPLPTVQPGPGHGLDDAAVEAPANASDPAPGPALTRPAVTATAAAAAAAVSGCLDVVPLPPAECSRFLSQAALGHTWEDVQALAASTIDQWLTAEFAKPKTDGHWSFIFDLVEALPSNDIIGRAVNPALVWRSWWRRAITAQDPLRMRVAFALSEIFVASTEGIMEHVHFVLGRYMDILEEHAFGNYRELLEAISLSPAMGRYLTYVGNRKADPSTGRVPDENYAREILQLFSIGLYELNRDGTLKLGANGQPIETYGQNDVVNLARVFTGWDFAPVDVSDYTRNLRGSMIQYPDQHAPEEKRFLGLTIPAGTNGETSLRMALDHIAAHPNVGPFICKQLIQRLVKSNPSPAYVARVADVFDNDGFGVRGSLKAVVRAILVDAEARVVFSSDLSVGKLREPVTRFIQWCKAFKVTSKSGKWTTSDLSNSSNALGQQPFKSPSVFNFFRPGYVPPGTQIGRDGFVAPEFQLVNETTVIGYVNFMQRAINNQLSDLVADYRDWLPRADRPSQLLTDLNILFAGGQIPPERVERMAAAVATLAADDDAGRTRRVQAAVLLVMCAPEYLVIK